MTDKDDEPDASEDGFEDMQLIPYFFYEVICRIIPGLLVIGLFFYWRDGNFPEVSAFVGSFAVVMAWVLGIIIDCGGYVVLRAIIPLCVLEHLGLIKNTARNSFGFNVLDDDDMFRSWQNVRALASWERSWYHKVMAMRIFFRSLSSICGVIALLALLAMWQLPSCLKDLAICFILAGAGVHILLVYNLREKTGKINPWTQAFTSFSAGVAVAGLVMSVDMPCRFREYCSDYALFGMGLCLIFLRMWLYENKAVQGWANNIAKLPRK